jgi:hypothetical protein
MKDDPSRRQWLGMAVVCAITMAAGIARSRLAQDLIKPVIRHRVPENREDGHDRGSGASVGRLGHQGPR